MTSRAPDRNKPPEHEADVIPIRSREVGIEHFLRTSEAEHEIKELYDVFDESPSIVETVHEAVSATMRLEEPNIYSLFLHPESAEGLTRLELVNLYNENPLVRASMLRTNLNHNEGDSEAARAYRDVWRLAMNMVRYEWLRGSYDAEDDKWIDRAGRLGVFKGKFMHMHLQPGFDRHDTVKRQPYPDSPSDELPIRPSTP